MRINYIDVSLWVQDEQCQEYGTKILEDDVDIERDIRERLREAWSVLPDDWDIVFLGEWLVLSSLQASFTILCQATVGRMRLVIPHFARRASPSHLDHSRRCPSTPHSRPSARMRTPSAALELAAFCSIYYTLRLRTRGRSTKHSHGSSKAGGWKSRCNWRRRSRAR